MIRSNIKALAYLNLFVAFISSGLTAKPFIIVVSCWLMQKEAVCGYYVWNRFLYLQQRMAVKHYANVKHIWLQAVYVDRTVIV